MVGHPVVWGKLTAIGAIVFAVLAGLFLGVYACFQVHPAAGWVVLAALIFGGPAGLYLLLRRLSRTGALDRLQLPFRRRPPGEGTPQASRRKAYVGRTAVAESPLRPSGAIRLGDDRVIATAEAGFIEKGATVKVVRAVGMNVVVRKVDQPS